MFEKIVTLVDRCRVEDATGRECGGVSSENAAQVDLPRSGGSPFSLATGCWRPTFSWAGRLNIPPEISRPIKPDMANLPVSSSDIQVADGDDAAQ